MSQARNRRRKAESFKDEVREIVKEMVAEAIPTIASAVVAQLQQNTPVTGPVNVNAICQATSVGDDAIEQQKQTSDNANQVLDSFVSTPSNDSGVSQASTLYGSSFNTSTGGDVQTLMSLSKYLAENALTVSTRNAYNRAKLMYSNFLSKYFTGAPLFPMSSEHIVLFISCCKNNCLHKL